MLPADPRQSRTKSTGLLLLLLALIAAAVNTQTVSAQDPVAADEFVGTLDDAIWRASKLIDDFVDAGGAPGVAISVGYDNRIIWNDGFGYADLEQRVPVWPEMTLFRVGSVAKPMTALALGQLYEQGRLDLDKPIQEYVPSFPEKRWPVSTRQVAGHLGGIRHYRGDEFYIRRHYATVEEGLSIFSEDTLLHRPGTRFSYSSYGYNLLSAVVEHASDETFLSYMDEHVFTPLGMNDTQPDQVSSIIHHRSRYYEKTDQGGFVNSPPVDNSYKWAGGGFLSTADDLVRFGFGHLHPKTISEETLRMLWEPQQTDDGTSTGYGIGWSSGHDEAGRFYAGHTGGSVGGTTYFRIYPESGLVIALIANVSEASLADLSRNVTTLFLNSSEN